MDLDLQKDCKDSIGSFYMPQVLPTINILY